MAVTQYPGGSFVLNPATGEYELAYLKKADGRYYRTLRIDGDTRKYSGQIPVMKSDSAADSLKKEIGD